MMVFINKVNNYMFRPKAAIFRSSQLQFCSKSVIYILHSNVEISSPCYMLQVSLSSGVSSGSVNGGVWISLVGYVLGEGGSLWGAVIWCSVYGSHVWLGWGGLWG